MGHILYLSMLQSKILPPETPLINVNANASSGDANANAASDTKSTPTPADVELRRQRLEEKESLKEKLRDQSNPEDSDMYTARSRKK